MLKQTAIQFRHIDSQEVLDSYMASWMRQLQLQDYLMNNFGHSSLSL